MSIVTYMTTNIAQKGINPTTGGAAFRDMAYNVLRSRPGQTLSPAQVAVLTGFPIRQISPALNGLNTKNYPFVHRLDRGQYVYDPSRAERVWSTFIQATRKPRKSRTRDVQRVASVVASAPRFVETFPVFERGSGGITLIPDAFVLKDDKGNLWQTTKV